MKNALTSWKKIAEKIAGRPIFIFLDYDGTLTPIVNTPDQALLSMQARQLLEDLARIPSLHLAIVSGRSLKDIQQRVSVGGIIYIGNHGLEIEGNGQGYISHVTPRSKKIIEHLRDVLESQLLQIPGVLLEDKGLTLSVHYRLVGKPDIHRLKDLVKRSVRSSLVYKKIHLREGKKVIEIAPALDWDKGKAVCWLLQKERLHQDFFESQVVPIYIGDDKTDEDAFRALKSKGLTILVGAFKTSSAQYRLKDPSEVLEFLRKILDFKNSF